MKEFNIRKLLPLFSAIGLVTALSAQNGQFDVRFSVKNVDCPANKVTILVQVKSHDAAHVFKMGDANYRFDYDPRQIANPSIVSQENFSNRVPSSDLNYAPQNLNGSSAGPTVGTVSLNTIYTGSAEGAKDVDINWMTVAAIRFDIINAAACFNLIWHDDQTFPVTGMNEVVPIPGAAFDYNLYIVAAGGIFGNLNACIPNICTPMVAINDVNTTIKNIPISGNLLTNDISSSAMTATTTPILAPRNGSIVINANGTYTYTPNVGFIGEDSIIYRVCNVEGICDNAILKLNVLNSPPNGTGNDAPIANDDVVTTFQGTTVTGNVKVNDMDPEGNTLTVNTTPILAPAHGVLTLNADGTFTFVPENGFYGTDIFKYQICDNGTPSKCDTATVTIKVLLDNNGTGNDKPFAGDDAFGTNANAAITASLAPNDFDPNAGNLLTYSTIPITPPAHGTLTLNSNGTFTYTPTAGYIGTDRFVYSVCDNGTPSLCDSAVAIVTMYPLPNQPPVVVKSPLTIAEDSTVTTCYAINDPDAGDLHNVTPCGVQHGTVTATVNNATHQVCVTYTPTLNYNGADTICLIVCDNAVLTMCDTVKIPVTVTPKNDKPVVTVTPTSVLEDSSVTVCAPITDPDVADTHTVTPCGAAHGTVTATINNVTHQLCATYVPTRNFTGTDTICVTVCDNGSPSLCDIVKIPVNVTPVNDKPTLTVTPQSVAEDNILTTCFPIVDPDVIDIYNVTPCGALHGLLTTTVNNATDEVCITYTPNTNYTGADTLCVIVCDNGTPSLCDTVRIPVTVTPVNDKPIVSVTPPSISEDTTITFCGTIADPDINDTHNVTPCGVQHGTVTATVNNGTHQLCITYRPTLNYNGADTICLMVCDNGTPSKCDTIKIPLNVTPKNDAPVVSDVVINTPEDSLKTYCLPITDPETSDNHTVTVCGAATQGTAVGTVNNATHELCVQYTPNPAFTGRDSVCYIVCDNQGGCDTVKVVFNVTPINHSPVAMNDINNTTKNTPATGNVIINDRDQDNNSMTVNSTPIQAPANGTIVLNPNGTYTYTPNPNFVGTDVIRYAICDNGIPSRCDTATLVIEIRDINPASGTNTPPIANDDNFSIPMNQTVTLNVRANDYDPQNGTIGNPTIIGTPFGGTLTVNPDGTIRFVPTPGFIGDASFRYVVCDNGSPVACDTATVTVNLYNVVGMGSNLPPVATDDANTTLKNTTLNGSVALNDMDPNAGQSMTFGLVTPTTNGTVSLNFNGSYTYTPNAGYTGPDQFRYLVCDNGSPVKCDTATVYLTIFEYPCFSLELKAVLEGCFDTVAARMKTTLNQRGLLPGQTPVGMFAVTTAAGHPYRGAPWNVTDTTGNSIRSYAADIVDWVLVSLRTDQINASSAVYKAPALLHSDGTITFINPCLTLDPNRSYYVVVEHRNHMGIMSSAGIPVVNGKLTYDFTVQNSYISGNPPTTGQKLKGGKYVMLAGDGKKDTQNTNFDINFQDSQLWKAESGIFDRYMYTDFNMDADVNFQDAYLWKLNTGKYSGVPH
jgi:Bacterial Ig domain